MPAPYAQSVFVNCPFDRRYAPMFRAIVFVVHDLGFEARCALEVSDATQNRYQKILGIIGQCRYGIHDISRTQPGQFGLPRFNMPLELGLFLGAKAFGDPEQHQKAGLILDRLPYRYQRFISDLAGQDVQSHRDSPERVADIREGRARVKNVIPVEELKRWAIGWPPSGC